MVGGVLTLDQNAFKRDEDRAEEVASSARCQEHPLIPIASATTTAVRRPFYRQLYFQVLIAIALGGAIGHFWPDLGKDLKPLGDAFIKLVKMVIAPVIFLTIVTGIAGMRDIRKVGGVALKALGYFLVVSTFALKIGRASCRERV